MPFDLSTDGASLPLAIAAVLGGAVWYFLKSRADGAAPADPVPADSPGWLAGLFGSRTAIVGAVYAAFVHRRELIDLAGKVGGFAWPMLVKIFGPNKPAPVPDIPAPAPAPEPAPAVPEKGKA